MLVAFEFSLLGKPFQIKSLMHCPIHSMIEFLRRSEDAKNISIRLNKLTEDLKAPVKDLLKSAHILNIDYSGKWPKKVRLFSVMYFAYCQTLFTIGIGLRACNTLDSLGIHSPFSKQLPMLFQRASALDNLTKLSLEEILRTKSMVSSLAAFLSRASRLTRLDIGFYQEDADLSALFQSILKSTSIQKLSILCRFDQENDVDLMLDLISESRFINDLRISPMGISEDHFYLAFESLESSQSIVKFAFSPFESDILEIDYERLAASVAENAVVNDLTLFNGEEEYDPDADDALDVFKTICTHLEGITIKGCGSRPKRDTDNLKQLTRLARTFSTSSLTQGSTFPRELIRIIVYEGFKDFWNGDQLSIVVRALLDRRTLGLIYGDILSLSRSYLFVRCRDALERIRSVE